MDQLIVDVLSYTQVARGDLPLRTIELEPIIRNIIATYPPVHGDGVTIDLHTPFPAVCGNDASVTQCLSNLLVNAVRFVKPGVKPVVHISGQSEGPNVRITIRDNGIGIPKEHQARIFGMFERLNPHYEGTGIGLAIVKKAAERMNGSVGVDSGDGQGSTFWLLLPAAFDSPSDC
jgi:signal transduction histidine kinase